jgi:hypothetical protein
VTLTYEIRIALCTSRFSKYSLSATFSTLKTIADPSDCLVLKYFLQQTFDTFVLLLKRTVRFFSLTVRMELLMSHGAYYHLLWHFNIFFFEYL